MWLVKPWTVQDAARELGIDEGFIRKVLNDKGIPGIEKIGRQWLGSPAKWRAWDEQRQKRKETSK